MYYRYNTVIIQLAYSKIDVDAASVMFISKEGVNIDLGCFRMQFILVFATIARNGGIF